MYRTLSTIALCFTAVGLIGTSTAFADSSQFALHKDDVVVFFGDSITENQLYTNFVESYVATRYPDLHARFFNAGWAGDSVLGGSGGPVNDRLTRDVIPLRPTMVVVMLGMNDVLFGAPPDPVTYAAGLQHIVEFLRANLSGVRITILRPSPYDDITRAPASFGGYSAILKRFGDAADGVAAANGLLSVDAYTPVVNLLQAANAANPTLAVNILPDRIHPGTGAALVIAGALLKAWNATPLVSGVDIDAAGPNLASSTNTAVTDLSAATTGNVTTLSWTELDGSLPIPIDPSDAVLSLCLASSNLLPTINQQPIRVRNLRPGRYLLRIDNTDIVQFTADQFGNTVDLAGIQTPMSAQSLRTHFYTQQHNQLHQVRWRQIQLPYMVDALPSYNPTLGAVDQMESDILTLQAAAARTAPHQFTVVGPLPASNAAAVQGLDHPRPVRPRRVVFL